MRNDKPQFPLTEDAKKRYHNKANYLTIRNIFVVLSFAVFFIGMTLPWSNSHRKAAEAQNKAHLKLLHNAVIAYKDIWGKLPYSQASYHGSFNFAEQLSKVAINDASFDKERRPMLLDFEKHDIYLSSEDYNLTKNTPATTIIDIYEQEFIYVYDKATDSFYIYSLGLDGEAGTEDDRRSDQLK